MSPRVISDSTPREVQKGRTPESKGLNLWRKEEKKVARKEGEIELYHLPPRPSVLLPHPAALSF